jgi:hypothetical protein
MTLDDIKRAKDARPFEPFTIVTADGHVRRVSHPDALSWAAFDSRLIHYLYPSGQWEKIDLASITSVAALTAGAEGPPRMAP